jgi:hypothetical protein
MRQRGGGVDIVVHHQQGSGRRARRSPRRRRLGAAAAAPFQRQRHREGTALPQARTVQVTLPPCSSTRFLTSARPSPRPPCERSELRLAWVNRSNTRPVSSRLHADALVAHRQHQACPASRRRPAATSMRRSSACTWPRCPAGWPAPAPGAPCRPDHQRHRRQAQAGAGGAPRACGRTCSTPRRRWRARRQGARRVHQAARDARDVQQVVDQAGHVAHLAPDDGAALAHPGLVQAADVAAGRRRR